MRNGRDFHRSHVGDKARFREGMTVRNVSAGSLQNIVSVLADIDRDLRADVPCQPVVVLMGMRDHRAQQAVVGLPETRNSRQQAFVPVIGRVERQPDIERDAHSLCLDLDTRAADLLRPPMYADSHTSPRTFLSIRDRRWHTKPTRSCWR